MEENYDEIIPSLSDFLEAYPRYEAYDLEIIEDLFLSMTIYVFEKDMIPAELWLDQYTKEYSKRKTALFDAHSVVADMTAYLIAFFGFERADPADYASDIRRIVKRHLSSCGSADPSRIESVTTLLIQNLGGDGLFSTIDLFRRIGNDPLLCNCDPAIVGGMIQDLFSRFAELGILTERNDI